MCAIWPCTSESNHRSLRTPARNAWRCGHEQLDHSFDRPNRSAPETGAHIRGLSMNKLIEDMSNHAIAAFDAETRLRALAAKDDRGAALAVLDRLDMAQ